MTEYQVWLFLQDGNSQGLNISSIGTNLLNNPVEKIITYKSFLKLIPNLAQDINGKSKLKMVAEWTISCEYYQLYGWISGPSSKINVHSFELDDYPDQDFFGDLILFKVDLTTHKCIEINFSDVSTIDIAKRDDDIDNQDDEEETDDTEHKDEYESESEEEKEKDVNEVGDEEDEEEEEEEDEDEDYDYEDDDKAEVDDGPEEDEDFYQDDDDEDGETTNRSKKKPIAKATVCNFSRLISNNILKEQKDKPKQVNHNMKQTMIIENFQKLLFPKKITKSDTNVLQELERGIYNWSIREADKKGFVCTWEDRNFIKIYIRKAISIYQNLSSDNTKLIKFAIEGDNAYKLSEMTPTELYPEKHAEIINKLKEKDKVMFEKRACVGSKHFKCGKCKERDVAVTTAQTRSGDEGITLFLTCNNCGNQWKMS
jgi:DNA-directed RNA polymerase subunit M/transcription elongation factor TFIIS